MSLVQHTPGEIERHVPPGARPLGVKVKPTLRLGLGRKDPDRGFPIKTDHFTVRGDNARALAKFEAEYGDEPKAVDITLRPELGTSLDIRYRAFGGGQHDGGGMVKAVGRTNFALLDWMGGPDTITVFGPDGVEEIEIDDKDDARAKELGIELAAQFTFGLPKVLSYGSVAAVSTRGKESIDTLWAKLREWHALAHWLQAPISRVTGQPLLVLKPSSMMAPKIEGPKGKKRQTGWQKSPLWVLDLLLQETQDEMVERVMGERQRTLEAGGAVAMLYGGPREPREIEAAREAAMTPPPGEPDDDDYEPVEGEVMDDPSVPLPAAEAAADAGVSDQQADVGNSSGATPSGPPSVPGFQIPDQVVADAGEVPVQDGWTVAATCVDKAGADYVRWALGPQYDGSLDEGVVAAMRTYATARHPELLGEVAA